MYTKHRQKNGHISSTRYVLVMLSFFLFNGLLENVSGNPREEVEDRGQRVAAHWISHRTAKREAETAFKDQFPERGEILVSAQDLKLVLQVERNQSEERTQALTHINIEQPDFLSIVEARRNPQSSLAVFTRQSTLQAGRSEENEESQGIEDWHRI